MAEHRGLVKKIPEETSKLKTFIDVLDKACETESIYSTEDHRKELEKYKYILRRALIEFKQLINESNSGFSCFWMSLLEMELKFSFVQLVPFMKTRLHVTHDDFVSVVHDAQRSMRGYSENIHANFERKFIALDPDMIESLDELFQDDWPCSLADIARFLLREWACAPTCNGIGVKGDAIICPSGSSLMAILSKAVKEYGETGMELKRCMAEKVFPVLSNKLDGVAAAENITVFIGTEEETGELSFRLVSATPVTAD